MLTIMKRPGRGTIGAYPQDDPPRARIAEAPPQPVAAVCPSGLPAAPRAPDLRGRVRGRLPRRRAHAGPVRRADRAAGAPGPGPVQPGARPRLRQGHGSARAARAGGAGTGDARPGRGQSPQRIGRAHPQGRGAPAAGAKAGRARVQAAHGAAHPRAAGPAAGAPAVAHGRAGGRGPRRLRAAGASHASGGLSGAGYPRWMPDQKTSIQPLRRLLLAGLFTLATGFAQAQSSAPVRILVGFPPGGGTDAIARTLADKLKDQLGVAVVVDNRAGAGGQIAAQALKAAPADGHTFFLSHDHSISILPLVTKNPGFEPATDCVPMAGFATFANALAVAGGTPARSLQEYVAY